MMKRLVASIFIFTAFSSTVVFAIDYSYNTSIHNKGSYKYKAIRLTPEIYNKISGDMADLVLYDKDNELVPYFINSFTQSHI